MNFHMAKQGSHWQKPRLAHPVCVCAAAAWVFTPIVILRRSFQCFTGLKSLRRNVIANNCDRFQNISSTDGLSSLKIGSNFKNFWSILFCSSPAAARQPAPQQWGRPGLAWCQSWEPAPGERRGSAARRGVCQSCGCRCDRKAFWAWGWLPHSALRLRFSWASYDVVSH